MIGNFVVDIGIALGGECPDDRVLNIKYPIYTAQYVDVVEALKEQGLKYMLKAGYERPDDLFYFTNEGTLFKVAPHLVLPVQDYIEGQADCDDYTRNARNKLSWKLLLSSFDAWGHIPGYHSFVLIMTGINKIGKFWLIEPNGGFEWAGVPFKIGEHDYRPRAFKH